jgi:hypothetical protein
LAIQERRHSCNANRWRFKSVDTPDNANRWRSESVDTPDNANRWRSESVDTPDNANRWRSESVDTPDNANRWRSKSVDALIDVHGTAPGAFSDLVGDARVLRLRHGRFLPVSGDSQ